MPLRVVQPTTRIPTMIMNTSKRLNKRNLGEQKEWTQGTTESGVSRVLFPLRPLLSRWIYRGNGKKCG